MRPLIWYIVFYVLMKIEISPFLPSKWTHSLLQYGLNLHSIIAVLIRCYLTWCSSFASLYLHCLCQDEHVHFLDEYHVYLSPTHFISHFVRVPLMNYLSPVVYLCYWVASVTGCIIFSDKVQCSLSLCARLPHKLLITDCVSMSVGSRCHRMHYFL